jgi:hypothetical protein
LLLLLCLLTPKTWRRKDNIGEVHVWQRSGVQVYQGKRHMQAATGDGGGTLDRWGAADSLMVACGSEGVRIWGLTNGKKYQSTTERTNVLNSRYFCFANELLRMRRIELNKDSII